MSDASPFTISRFEYERKHLYFLPADLFSQLETPSPAYLIGSRGTGKTTLLKALTSTERLHNKSLQQQVGENPFTSKYIGVYLKLPSTQLQLLDSWLSNAGEFFQGWCMALFTDFVWLELVINAIAELIIEGVLLINPEQEHACVHKITRQHVNALGRYLCGSGPFTLDGLSDAIRMMKSGIEKAALRRADWQEIVDRYPTGQIGSFGREVAKSLAALCDSVSGVDDAKWRFMICMDEGECLNSFQQRMMNTLVRLSEWPVFLKVAFVSLPADTTNTLVPSITLQKADRNLHALDEMNDSEFKELAEGVASIRVKTALGDPEVAFSVSKIFGQLGINDLLHDILKVSVRPKAKSILKKAAELKHTAFFKEVMDANDDGTHDKDYLPIYQTYLVEALNLKVPAPDTEGWQRRRQESAELRKRMVAAYLGLCHELGTNVRYASGEMLLQMSDKCMRDFLSQIQEVFRENGKPLEEFLCNQIPTGKQDNALHRASKAKKDSLPLSGVPSPPQTSRIVDGLAKLTTFLQCRGRANENLRSIERGIFQIDVSDAERRGFINELKLLVDAGEAGFLKILSNEGNVWSLRVHASLAAAYEFSYRGAYYPIRVGLSDIRKLSESPDTNRVNSIVNEIGAILSGQETSDLPLFDNNADE